MSVPKEEIIKIAKLAKLKLNDNEIEKFTSQFNQILDYMKKLNEINTDEVQPLSHPLEINNVMRDDELKDSIPRELALSNAPDKDDKFFKVPKVIK
ncbi:MAG: Asp-tRNA(Asn)/Glu-tRNA(Gln) amidotransferase subunit GatC [Ignavibacterium sp.]|nr:Asp-tRNA(Asn)/Glu-tRNA(Gln) amidotransferase subunit GatC [Ignavibacterium sp.]MDW8375248.1 Asp-tRNA(Asn)/Glu-tRNA(Gln) amidotransferase subunit GatC [Ignavibacteriales bacterium]